MYLTNLNHNYSIQNIVLFVVVFLSCLCSNFHSDQRIVILTIGFFFLLILLINGKIKISKSVTTICIILLISGFFNMDYFIKYLLNISNIILLDNLIKNNKSSSNFIIIYKSIFTYFILSFLLLFLSDYTFSTSKFIFGLELKKRIINNFNISNYSLSLGYLFFLIPVSENKNFKFLLKTILLLCVIYLGKLSVVLAILIALIVARLKTRTNTLSFVIILGISSLSPFLVKLFYLFFENNNLSQLFAGRNVLWLDFCNYIINQDIYSLLFGNGFYSSHKISYEPHPHNQYLSVLFIGGLFLFYYYHKFLYTIYKRVSFSNAKEHFVLLLFLVIVQATDDYFILTIYPLPLIILLSLNNYSNK